MIDALKIKPPKLGMTQGRAVRPSMSAARPALHPLVTCTPTHLVSLLRPSTAHRLVPTNEPQSRTDRRFISSHRLWLSARRPLSMFIRRRSLIFPPPFIDNLVIFPSSVAVSYSSFGRDRSSFVDCRPISAPELSAHRAAPLVGRSPLFAINCTTRSLMQPLSAP